MMSYLWILLLGSLLAGSAKAQDDAAPEENTAAPESPTSESDTAPEPEADEGTAHNAEELQPTVKEPESADDAEAVTPADEGAVTPADADKEQDTPVDADKEQDTPADADAEPETPKDEGAVTPADGNAEAVTPAADTEAEATTPAQDPAPAADPEVKEPETGEPAEEQPASNTEAPPVQEEDGSEGDTKLAADPTVADNAGPTADAKPTVPVDEDKIVPDSEKGVDALVPTVKVDLPNVDLGLNLEDALPEGNAVDKNARKGKSLGSNAQAAEATGDADKPEAQESSSGSIAGILSAIVVAAVGAVAGYFTYQKKKLCFKDRQAADPEAARKADAVEAQSDPQVLSNLLNSS